MKMICRAVPERLDYAKDLLAVLPELDVLVDELRDPLEHFVRALRHAGDEPCLHLEDDAIPCEDFYERASVEIARRPDRVIQFFSMKPEDVTSGSRFDDHFVGGVCFYLPATYSRLIADYAPHWPKRASNPTALDIMVRHWLRKQRDNEAYWIVVPNLADHRVGPSSIDVSRPERRQSLTFSYR